MICPKCGRPVDENAVICRGCDFILDTGFLGDGILDEEQQLRPGAGGVDPAAFNLADAVILGNIDDDSQSFETSDSGFHMQAHLQARLYVSGRSQALMSPDAVPALQTSNSVEGVRLTPFERHVLAFIDGKRPVEVIRRAAGLDEAEVKTALATLADKGVVKVVGRALADFDPGTETAPRRAPQRHRMRGSVVGAVALVGDEADKAIEEAFRTQVAFNPLSAPGAAGINAAAAAAAAADGDVFGDAAGGGRKKARDTGPQPAAANQNLSDLPSDLSDVEQFMGLKGTDEIEKPPGARGAVPRPEASSSTLRPSAQKAAINRAPSGKIGAGTGRVPLGTNNGKSGAHAGGGDDSQEGIDASAEASAVERSIADKSDGFDDFGQPSDVSTAVVAQQLSDSSAPNLKLSASPDRPASGVFADISDADGGDGAGPDLASVQQLADSRVQPRPSFVNEKAPPSARVRDEKAPQQPPPPPPDSFDDVSAAIESGDTPSVEIERRAASGEVWDENPQDKPRPPSSSKHAPNTASASLSDLLSDNDEEATANIPPERAAQMIALGQKRRAAMDSSFEEPTAAGQPPPPLPLPRVGPKPGGAVQAAPPAMPSSVAVSQSPPAEATSSRAVHPHRVRSAMVSMPDEAGVGARQDERSGLHDVGGGGGGAGAGKRPAASKGKKGGAVHDIFDDASDSAAGFQPPTGPADPVSEQQPRLSSDSSSSDGSAPGMSDSLSSSSQSMPSQMMQSIEVRSVHESAEEQRSFDQRSVADDDSNQETAPPSQLPASEASPSPSMASSEPDPPPISEAPSERDPSMISSEDSSSEMVDSGLVIRPAGKGPPRPRPAMVPRSNPRVLASSEASTSDPRIKPAMQPGGRVPPSKRDDPNATFAQSLEESLGSLEPPPDEESSEATINIDRDEQKRRGLDAARGMNGNNGAAPVERGRTGGVAAIPSGFSQVVEAAGARPRVTDENRRKARKLFEEATKEAESGRLGAARMNAKLASIYDPENAIYREQLEAWENPPPQKPQTVPATSASQMSSRPSDESQIEIKALYDEAQMHEDSGEIDEALEILEQGVARFPGAAAFYNRIGVILALRKRDYEGAVQAIQRAIDIDPENLHYKSNLGKIVAKMRNRGEA